MGIHQAHAGRVAKRNEMMMLMIINDELKENDKIMKTIAMMWWGSLDYKKIVKNTLK